MPKRVYKKGYGDIHPLTVKKIDIMLMTFRYRRIKA